MIKRVRSLLRWMPISWKSAMEFYFDNSLGKEFGGAFNGQTFRQSIFKDLIKTLPFEAIIETGTFRGATTEFMSEHSKLPVYTVEAESRIFHYAKLKLRRHKNIKISLGDSRDFICRLIEDKSIPKNNVFFYLDAHWQEDLPLYKEVELIGNNWQNAVIMIDDFKVSDDAGYIFDDYGNGKRLSLEYLLPLLKDWSVFFPKASSEEETGLKRGSVVLVSKSLEDKVKQIPSLRIYDISDLANVS